MKAVEIVVGKFLGVLLLWITEDPLFREVSLIPIEYLLSIPLLNFPLMTAYPSVYPSFCIRCLDHLISILLYLSYHFSSSFVNFSCLYIDLILVRINIRIIEMKWKWINLYIIAIDKNEKKKIIKSQKVISLLPLCSFFNSPHLWFIMLLELNIP